MIKQHFSQHAKRLSRFDTEAQLIRVLACMIVIACHIRLDPVVGYAKVGNARLLINCLTNDGVTIFFTLTGCFLFSGKKIGSIYWSAIKTVLIPVALVCALSLVLSDWVAGTRPFLDCLLDPQKDLSMLYWAFVAQNPALLPSCGHFWYIVNYMQVALLYPIFRALCVKGSRSSRIGCGWLVAVFLFNQILADYSAYTGKWVATFPELWAPGVLTVLGFLIYEYRDQIRGNLLCRILSGASLVGITALRFILQKNLLVTNGSTHFYYWNTSCAVIFAASLILFILSFRIPAGKGALAINYLGTKTFFIYMIHVLTHEKLTSLGFSPWLYENTVEALQGIPILGEALYTLGFVLVVFGISLVISILWEILSLGFRTLWNRCKHPSPASH